MINPNMCFQKLNSKSIFISKNFNNLLNNAEWAFHFGFKNFSVPDFVWKLEPILNKIHNTFPIQNCVVLHIPPNTMYNWHNDSERGLSINMKLCNNTTSHTLFGSAIDEYSDAVIELKYDKDAFYLFNTQNKHCVINFDNDRYMFSVLFKNQELSYETVYNWCKENEMF
jgi:hypothetical protein